MIEENGHRLPDINSSSVEELSASGFETMKHLCKTVVEFDPFLSVIHHLPPFPVCKIHILQSSLALLDDRVILAFRKETFILRLRTMSASASIFEQEYARESAPTAHPASRLRHSSPSSPQHISQGPFRTDPQTIQV